MACIMCGTNSNLNTEMSVTVEGKTYKISLCDAHADECTMGQLKKKIKEIKLAYEKVVRAAKSIGIEESRVVQTPEAEPIAPPVPPTPRSAPENAVGPDSETESDLSQQVIPDNAQQPAPTPQVHKTTAQSVAFEIGGKEISENKEAVEVQKIEGRGGKPTVIPKKLSGELGDTEIYIAKSDDSLIQKRFKSLDQTAPDPKTEGYTTSPCHACGGKGIHPITKGVCPACSGSGFRI